MSVFIKTMTDLPEHCWECPCHDGESGYCQADEEHRYSDYRPFWCPLMVIDIPMSEAELYNVVNYIHELLIKIKLESEDKNGHSKVS